MKRPARLKRAAFPKYPRRIAFSYGAIAVQAGLSQGVSVVVSKRVAPLATTRNRIKRRVYAALHAPGSAYKGAIIVYPKITVLSAKFKDLALALNKAIPRR